MAWKRVSISADDGGEPARIVDHRHGVLPAGEGAVDRRQVGDEERQQDQADHGLAERHQVGGQVGGPGEAQGQQRRSAGHEGRPERVDAERPEQGGVAGQGEGQPHHRQDDQRERGVEGHGPVPLLVGVGEAAPEGEDPPCRSERRSWSGGRAPRGARPRCTPPTGTPLPPRRPRRGRRPRRRPCNRRTSPEAPRSSRRARKNRFGLQEKRLACLIVECSHKVD